MELHCIKGFLNVNIYFLVNRITNSAVLIDCGTDVNLVNRKAKELNVEIKAVLLTHAHYDHAGCAAKLQKQGANIYIAKKEVDKLFNTQNLAHEFAVKFESFTPDQTFDDNQIIKIEDFNIKALLTPGHTDGSATFLLNDMLFTGDTLFDNAVGRTDFPTGNALQLKESILRLYALDGDYVVYPGHYSFTKLSDERKYNMFIRL